MTAKKGQEPRELLKTQKLRYDQVKSALEVLYDEMDKLNRKAPSMDISELTLDRVNKTIRSVKMLLAGANDDFVEEITEFVPAGEMPEYRDVVLELSQLKAGMTRFGDSQRSAWRTLDSFYG